MLGYLKVPKVETEDKTRNLKGLILKSRAAHACSLSSMPSNSRFLAFEHAKQLTPARPRACQAAQLATTVG